MISRESSESTSARAWRGEQAPPGGPRALVGGRYQLEALIGQGALGWTWRARQINMGRAVALKVLRPDISGHPKTRRKLVERVQRVQQLQHPNNCRLLDFGQFRGALYLVTELLEGAPLRSIIEHGAPYSVGWVLDIGRQILDGLGEAHQLGIIHRNLKPRNIFLLPRRRGGQHVKITDYALASCLDVLPGEDPDDPREPEICGTAAYLAPETLLQQVSTKPGDVYAAALVLVEMLSGEQVFKGASLGDVLYRQIHADVYLPPKLAWTCMGKVLLRALSKHPDNRFADADEFYSALERAAQRTAPYFRLNADDLAPCAVDLSIEPREDAQRHQRARRKSSRPGPQGGDKGNDDTDPHPGRADPRNWCFLPQAALHALRPAEPILPRRSAAPRDLVSSTLKESNSRRAGVLAYPQGGAAAPGASRAWSAVGEEARQAALAQRCELGAPGESERQLPPPVDQRGAERGALVGHHRDAGSRASFLLFSLILTLAALAIYMGLSGVI